MLRSLRSRLVVLLALALLPAVVLAMIQALESYRRTTELAEHSVLRTAAIAAGEEENAIVAARQTLALLARLPAVRSQSPAACAAALNRVKASDQRYGNFAVLNLDGAIVCSTAQDQEGNFAQAPWFDRTLENDGFTVSAGIVQRLTEGPVFLTTLPIKEENGEISGIIGLSLKQAWLRNLIRETDLAPETHIALLDRAGNLLTADVRQGASSAWLPKANAFGEWLNDSSEIFQQESQDGNTRVFAVTPLYEDQVFVVFAGLPGQLMQNSQLRLLTGVGYPLLMWVIAVAVAWFAVDRLVLRSVLSLRETAQAYSRGEFERRTKNIDSAPEELHELGVTLHNMADAISLHESTLRGALDEQKSLLAEVYHRVKNNLQVMSSLLNLQISRSKGETEIAALRMTQNRIHALSMVHSHMYEAGDLNTLSFDQFLPQLCRYLHTAQAKNSKNLRLRFDVDPLPTEPDKATPLALLVTEALSSILTRIKWQEEPVSETERSISIALKGGAKDDGSFLLTILAQGLSLTAKAPDDLSGKLIQSFAKQLHAVLEYEEDIDVRLVLKVPG